MHLVTSILWIVFCVSETIQNRQHPEPGTIFYI